MQVGDLAWYYDLDEYCQPTEKLEVIEIMHMRWRGKYIKVKFFDENGDHNFTSAYPQQIKPMTEDEKMIFKLECR